LEDGAARAQAAQHGGPGAGVGDGVLGIWAAAREVWLAIREQSCWCHKLPNLLNKLPRRLHAHAERMPHEMIYAAQRSDCEVARVIVATEYQAKQPKR
jgi:putative transposase